MTKLDCSDNQLTTLDVSKNTALTELSCYNNQLTTFDVSKNTKLSYIDCTNNKITALEVSSCTALTTLSCSNNQLTALDVSKNTTLTRLICSKNQLTLIKLGNNTKLSYIDCKNNKMTALDTSGCPNLTTFLHDDFGEPKIGLAVNSANFPDAAFMSYVSYYLDQDGNGCLSVSEISSAKEINLSYGYNGTKVKSLNGIEHFTALTTLDCRYNELTTLDVSKNTALTELECSNNKLTTFDVSKNTALTTLYCYNNELTSLKLGSNTALTTLYCYGNQIATLDVSKNTALKTLDCDNNKLTTLDVSKNTALTRLECNNNLLTTLDVGKNTALKWLECNNNLLTTLNVGKNTALKWLECENNKLTSVDTSGCTKLTVFWHDDFVMIDSATFPDAAFRSYVSDKFDKDKNGSLSDSEISSIKTINLSYGYNGTNVKSLKGIEYFTALTTLDCCYNELTTLDVSKNTALTRIECYNNKLTSLKLGSNIALTTLWCYNNQLTELDVSKNTALTTLKCHNNELTTLDLSKNTALTQIDCDNNKLTSLKLGSNTKLSSLYCRNNKLTTLDISGCPNLSTFYHDFVAVDSTNFPDDAFRSYVSDKIDKDKNGYLDVSEISSAKTIDLVSGYNGTKMKSLKGIKHFTALTYLDCRNNELTELDLSRNTALKYLNCKNNKLSKVDMSGCTKQENGIERDEGVTVVLKGGIAVDSTSFPDTVFREYVISEFDSNGDGCLSTSEIAAAKDIEVTEKGITSLKGVEYFTALISLGCNHNQLTELNVSKNTALDALACSYNQLTALDVGKNTALTCLYCENNQLTELNVSNNTALKSLRCNNNQLTKLNLSSENTALKYLECNNNQLSDLYVGYCTDLIILRCNDNQLTNLYLNENTDLYYLQCENNKLTELDISDCPYLARIVTRVDLYSVPASLITDHITVKNGFVIDDITTINIGVEISSLNFPDSVFRNYVSANFDKNGNGYLSTSEIAAAKTILVGYQDITSLKGVEYLTALEFLSCTGNQLTELDVSKNTALTRLSCRNNKLTKIYISNRYNLTSFTYDYGVTITEKKSAAPSITTTSLPSGKKGTAYSASLSAEGDTPITWSVSGLPSGLCVLNTGTITGTPTESGTFTVNINATNPAGSDSKSFTLTVNTAASSVTAPSITTTSLPSGKKGTAYSATLSATGTTPITWSASGLPGGLSCSSSGTISGTPASSGTYSVTVTAANTAGSVSKTFTVNIVSAGSSSETSEVAISSLNFPDSVFREYVSTTFDNDKNGYLSSSEIAAAKSIFVSNKGITSLKGVEYFAALESLFCSNNQLTALDVSKNTALARLYCKDNKLTEIYISDRSNQTIFSYDYGVTVIKKTEDDIAPEFKAHQPDLDGIIVVNFYAYMPEISGVNYNSSYVNFKILNDTSYNPTQEYDPSFTAAGKLGTYYGFRCCVTSVQMADPITATLHYGNGLTVEHTYKLTDYLDKYYYASATPELLRNVVGAMKDYGHYAQIALAEVNGWEIGKDHLETNAANVYTASDIEKARQAVDDYAKSWDVGNSGIKSIGYRLALDADTIIELFIRPNDDYNGNVSAYSRGVIGITDTSANIAVKQSDGRYLVQISGIPAHRLDYTNVIRVVTDKGEFDVKVSALSYVNTILNSEKYNDNMKKAVTSLYKYHKAAKEYWENNNQ